MNKTVNINLAGIFFHIDEDAYLKLQGYLEAIKRSFTDSQGQSEIITDIEARISELFTERIKNDRQVISVKEVDDIITIMGQPEDYLVDDEIFEDEPQPTLNSKPRSNKRLFRDTNNSYIGGVSSGLAHYIGIDTIWIRLIWVLLIFGAGTGVLLYILLWILVPEAKTTAEKIMMTGDPVNISNIEKKIKDGLENVTDTVTDVAKNVSDSVSDAVKNVDFQKQGDKIKSTSKRFFSTLGGVFKLFFKIFSKFIGLLLVFTGAISIIALIISLFSVGIVNAVHLPGLDLIEVANTGDTPIWLISLLAIFFVGIPLFFIFYLGLKILVNNLKSIGNIAKFSLLGLWITAGIGLFIIGIKQANAHAFDEFVTDKNELYFSKNEPLKVRMVSNNYYRKGKYNSRKAFKIITDDNNNKTLYSSDVRLIIKSTSDTIAQIHIEKSADGSNSDKAIDRAKAINYGFELRKNELFLNSFLTTDVTYKYGDQDVVVVLYLPEGTVINLSKNTKSYLNYYSRSGNIVKEKYINHHIKILEDAIECLDCPITKEEGSNHYTKGKTAQELVNNHDSTKERKLYLKKLTDPTAIAEIAINDDDVDIRKMAVNKITYQPVLAQIAKNDRSSAVRTLALKKITFQPAIAEIAKNDKDAKIRKMAVTKMTFQPSLAEIAKNDKDSDIRKLALSKMTFQPAIAEIAKTDRDPEIRKMAVKKMTFQPALIEISKNDKNAEIRKIANKKINK